jgi:cysteine desulfurase
MGLPHEWAVGSLRLTLGKSNTEEDIENVLEVLPRAVARLREMQAIAA